MKKQIVILASILCSLAAGHAAVTINGTSARTVQYMVGNTVTAVPTGSLVLYLADTGTSGFGAATANSILPGVDLNVGDSFGGDLIIGRSATNALGTGAGFTFTFAGEGSGLQLAPGTRFAVVWFAPKAVAGTIPTTTTATAAGMVYGIATNLTGTGDWLTPGATGSYGFVANNAAPTAASPFRQATLTSGNADAILNGQIARYEVVPEPSTAALGLLAGLGLVARRRRA